MTLAPQRLTTGSAFSHCIKNLDQFPRSPRHRIPPVKLEEQPLRSNFVQSLIDATRRVFAIEKAQEYQVIEGNPTSPRVFYVTKKVSTPTAQEVDISIIYLTVAGDRLTTEAFLT